MISWFRNQYLDFIKASKGVLSLREVSRSLGVPYHSIRSMYSDLSSILEMRFLVDYPSLRLLPIAVLSEDPCPEWVARTLLARVEGNIELKLCLGLAPLKKAIEAGANLEIVKGVEVRYWDYNFYPASTPREPVEKDYETPRISQVYTRRPDAVDIALYSFKIDHPFLKATRAYERARSVDGSLREISSYAVEYHFRRHLKPLWVGNGFYLVLPSSEVPVQVYIVEGWRSPALARIASSLTGHWFSLIDEKRSLIVGQFRAQEKVGFYRAVRALGCKNVYGELVVPPGESSHWRPLLWKSLRDKDWAPPFMSVESSRPVFP